MRDVSVAASAISATRTIRDIEMDIDLRRREWMRNPKVAEELLAELEAAGGGRARLTRKQRRALHAQMAKEHRRGY